MMISALFADRRGNIYDHPHLRMAGRSGHQLVRVEAEELIRLPEGSKLFFLPGREGVGWDLRKQEFVTARMASLGDRRRRGLAVSSFLPPAYTRTLLPATPNAGEGRTLPLWSYTAVGWTEHGLMAAAVRTDPVDHSESKHYDDRVVVTEIESHLKRSPANRLLRQLACCATQYHCFAAKTSSWAAGRPLCPLPLLVTLTAGDAYPFSPRTAALPPRSELLSCPRWRRWWKWRSLIWKGCGRES
jgi:hypothetical protein